MPASDATEPVTVRPSTATDVPAITSIYAAEVRDGLGTLELEPPDESTMARRRRACIEAGLPHLVAVVDQRVVGYACAGAFREREGYRYTVEDSVYVAGWSRRRGVGAKLLAALIVESENIGKRRMVALISGGAPSIALHEAAGFIRIGCMSAVGWKFHNGVDVVIMQRPLGPDAEAPVPT